MLQVADSSNNVAIDSRGIGMYLNGEGVIFGYSHDQCAYINDLSKCITVIFEGQTKPLICKTK